ncbi:hypothetical protein LTR10_012039 [Elasticomyces elasticus]|nr:hypothetical protein LTR10_012039 [Elasticomyces elasticus]KAK4968981.1 hypothetical protein LTR42_009260 [Elasticomyces elasticus]
MPETNTASPRPILKQQDSYAYSEECASPSSYLGMSYTASPRMTPKFTQPPSHVISLGQGAASSPAYWQ